MTKIKNKLLVVLIALFAFCMAISFATMTNTTLAAEQTPIANVDTVAMSNGAQARLKVSGEHQDKTGIRFTLLVNESWYTTNGQPEIGMYISRIDDLGDDKTYDSIDAIPANALHYVATNFVGDTESDNDVLMFNAVVYDIPDDQFGTKLIANGYYKIGDATEVFANNPQTASIAKVASEFLADGLEDDPDNLDILYKYVEGVITEENFKFTNTNIRTDVYKTAEPTLGATTPADLKVVWESSDSDVVSVDENGNLTRGTKFGTATITATIGRIVKTATINNMKDPALFLAGVDSADSIYMLEHIGAPETTQTDNFGGIYTGESVFINAYTNAEAYKVKNDYSIAELNNIKNAGYESVTFWVACDVLTQGQISFYPEAETNDGATVASTLGMNNSNAYKFIPTTADRTYGKEYNTENWYKITLAIDKFITLMTDENGNAKSACPIWASWAYNVGSSSNKFFFGDMVFEKYPNITNSDMAKTKVDKYVWQADGITGDYDGTALRYQTYVNSGYKYYNPYSAEELEEMKAKYSTVSLPFAAKCDAGGFWLTNGGFEGIYSSTDDRYQTNFKQLGVWHMFTITIEQYIDLVAANNYEWFKPFTMTSNNPTNFYYYIGELQFN